MECAPGESDDLNQMFDVWAKEIGMLFYDAALTREFLGALRDWVLSQPRQSEERLSKLNDLVQTLAKGALSRTSRLKTLREWVDLHVLEPAELRQIAFEQLRVMNETFAMLKA